MYKIALVLMLGASCAIALLSFSDLAKANLKYFDWKFLDGIFSRSFLTNEPKLNFAGQPLSDYSFDYSWLDQEDFISIAHRGGNHRIYGQNTREAVSDSLATGRRFIELDLVMNQERSNIECLSFDTHLGQACDIDWLIEQWKKFSFFLILDLKIDVHNPSVYSEFFRLLRKENGFDDWNSNIIAQAYNFDHFQILKDNRLINGPIFTAYRSSIPTSILLEKINETRIMAVTLPIARLGYLGEIVDSPRSFFVHPVETIEEYETVRTLGLKGIYSSRNFEDDLLTGNMRINAFLEN